MPRAVQLDPVHYFMSPGLSWDTLLKKTGVELELLTDLEMDLFVERGMRGGIAMVRERYAKANNTMLMDYDPANRRITSSISTQTTFMDGQ